MHNLCQPSGTIYRCCFIQWRVNRCYCWQVNNCIPSCFFPYIGKCYYWPEVWSMCKEIKCCKYPVNCYCKPDCKAQWWRKAVLKEGLSMENIEKKNKQDNCLRNIKRGLLTIKAKIAFITSAVTVPIGIRGLMQCFTTVWVVNIQHYSMNWWSFYHQ